jgi:hypothetical protein
MGAGWIAFANDPLWGARFEVLLEAAKRLRDDGHPEAAIVTAQTACEVCTERVMTETFLRRRIDYLSDPLGRLLPNYNIGNDRVRKIYEAVTNDSIAAADNARWQRFQQHVKKRQGVVHGGQEATPSDADASITVVEEVIEHVRRHYYDTWL